MHVSKLISCFSGGDNPPETTPTSTITTDEFKIIKEMIQNISNQTNTIQKETKFTNSLTDEDVSKVLDVLLSFQERVFCDVPLTDTFKRPFLFNIPKPMFDYFIDVFDKGYDDVLNPMLLFYIFNAFDPELFYGRYLKTLKDVLNANGDTIDEYASVCEEYIASMYDETEETDHEQDD